jgi:5-methyltetrahydrofolate--homocysteine methyltransferase
LEKLLATGKVLLADGATGTNYFQMGLTAGEPPEFWLDSHPERVAGLHQQFVNAGADIILTNTFGANRHRLKLHRRLVPESWAQSSSFSEDFFKLLQGCRQLLSGLHSLTLFTTHSRL